MRANTETMITVRRGQLCLNRHSAQRCALPDSTGNRSCSGSSSFQSRNRSDTACSRALSQHWHPHVSAFRDVLQLLCRGCELTRCLAALVAQCTHSDRAPAAGAASGGGGGGAGAAGAGGVWAAAERGDGGGACQALVLSAPPSAEVRAPGKVQCSAGWHAVTKLYPVLGPHSPCPKDRHDQQRGWRLPDASAGCTPSVEVRAMGGEAAEGVATGFRCRPTIASRARRTDTRWCLIGHFLGWELLQSLARGADAPPPRRCFGRGSHLVDRAH